MTTTTHTPTPWPIGWVNNGRAYERDDLYLVIEHDDPAPKEPHKVWEAIIVKGAKAEANAAFIVTACNAHDELVAALREIVDRNVSAYDGFVDSGCVPYGSILAARAALAKVTP